MQRLELARVWAAEPAWVEPPEGHLDAPLPPIKVLCIRIFHCFSYTHTHTHTCAYTLVILHPKCRPLNCLVFPMLQGGEQIVICLDGARFLADGTTVTAVIFNIYFPSGEAVLPKDVVGLSRLESPLHSPMFLTPILLQVEICVCTASSSCYISFS